MGLMFRQDFSGSPGLHKSLEDLPHHRVIDTGGQLSIGKCSGPAHAKLHIGSRIKIPRFPKTGYIFHTFMKGPAPLQHKRTVTVLCQFQSGNQSCRTCADHNGAFGHRDIPHMRGLCLNRYKQTYPRTFYDFLSQRLGYIYLSYHMIQQTDIVLSSCIYGTMHHLHLPEGAFLNSQFVCYTFL